MTRITKILKKNFKLLLKSKMTSLVIFLGPLLIILLVGLAFNNNSFSQFNVGVYTPEHTELTEQFIDTMVADGLNVINHTTQEECVEGIRQGTLHTCVVFPTNFYITENQSKEITFYADYSKTNLVAIVRESMMKNIDLQKQEVSTSLTENIVSTLAFAREQNDEVLLQLVNLKADTDAIKTDIDKFKKDLTALDLESVDVNTEGLSAEVTALEETIDDLYDESDDLVDTGYDLVVNVEDLGISNSNLTSFMGDFETDLDSANDSIQDKYNDTSVQLKTFLSILDTATSQVGEIEKKLEGAKTFKSSGSTSLNNIQTNLDNLKESTNAIKGTVEAINTKIDNVEVKSVASIVNPITTKVEPVASHQSNITYMFPFLIILVIMFVSILLASTMIIMEKTSKAYFRTFTTPTKDITFVIAAYLTNLLVILIQLGLLLGVAYVFLKAQLIVDVPLMLAVIFIAITLFTVIGMAIGYWFNTQEAAIMMSMAVGSVFLLVSNLILPLESMPVAIQELAAYNPYVLLSEIMRKIILFNAAFETIYLPLAILLGASIIIFLVIILIQKLMKIKYFTKSLPHTKKPDKKSKKKHGIKSFKMYEKVINTKEDLIEELEKMDDHAFTQYVDDDKNDFYNWAKYVLKDKKLAAKLKVKTRKEMIDSLKSTD